MGFFDNLRQLGSVKNIAESVTELSTLRTNNLALNMQAETLHESMKDLILFIEDYQWVPIDGYEDAKGFPLEVIKSHADRSRALLAANPVVKKAINARIAYVWGKEFEFRGGNITRMVDSENNQYSVFGSQAREELEKLLATDGNVFAVRNNTSKEINLIPLEEIAGVVTDPEFHTKVTHYLRRWVIEETDFKTGVTATVERAAFYPTDFATTKPKTIQDIPVDNTKTMIHVTANKQANWIWGIGDITATLFWVRAHKELFEDGKKFVTAQGRYAAKILTKSQAGAANAAATVATAARRDPMTGEPLDVGGTAVLGGGVDMQLLGKMSGGVDFSAFEPVLGLVAVGLDVPLSVLTGEADDEKSLEQSIVLTMRARQRLWGAFYKSLFGTKQKVEVIWPPIKSEPTHRQVQSIEVINNTNVMKRSELRQLALEAFGMQGDPNDLPSVEDNPQIVIPVAVAKEEGKIAAAAAKIAAKTAVTPGQGESGKVGKLADNDHSLRDEGGQAHTDK